MAKTKKEIKNVAGAEVGDVLVATWGYDQTNYDFYKVIKITEKTVTLEKLNGYDSGTIYKNKRTSVYGPGYYWVTIDSVRSAKFNIENPKHENYEQIVAESTLYNAYYGH